MLAALVALEVVQDSAKGVVEDATDIILNLKQLPVTEPAVKKLAAALSPGQE